MIENSGTGFQPVKTFNIYRRNLPHWQLPGSVYFVTFRTFGDIILPENARDIVFNSVMHWENKKFSLYGAVVMHNHVHIILQPLEKIKGFFFSLAEILHSIKSYSSNHINKIFRRTGPVWLDENFDRIIRNEKELREKMHYIINNPLRLGLIENYKDYKWLYMMGIKEK